MGIILKLMIFVELNKQTTWPVCPGGTIGSVMSHAPWHQYEVWSGAQLEVLAGLFVLGLLAAYVLRGKRVHHSATVVGI